MLTLQKLLDNYYFSLRQAVRTVSRLIGNGNGNSQIGNVEIGNGQIENVQIGNVEIENGQIENVQIGNTQIGSWEMLRLAEWNGPSRPPYNDL